MAGTSNTSDNGGEAARILALDLGAESGRGVVGTLRDGTLALREVNRFINGPVHLGGTMYWDLLRIMAGARASIGQALVDGPLASMGVDTWGVDFALLDERGAILGMPVHFRDGRTRGAEEWVYERMGRAEVYQATGIQTMPINTLFQLVGLWQRSPRMVEAAHTLLFIPDLIHYYLTGTRQAEYTIASTSQFLNAETRQWADTVLSNLGIPTHFLPPIVPDGTVYGSVLPEEQAILGRTDATVIAPGGHDTACAVAAVPAEAGSNWAYLSSGTWSLLGVEVPRPILTPDAQAANLTNEGGVAQTIRLLKNIGGLWLVQECRRAYARLGSERTYEQLTRLASEAAPLAAVINPDHPTLLAPSDMPKAIRELCLATGQTPPEGIGATIRCCLDSLGLKYRLVLDALERITGQTLDTLHIVGGGTQNYLLNQIAADATGRTVYTGPVEATAIGNILLQAKAQGMIADLNELRAIVRRSFPMQQYTPDDTARAAYDGAYRKFAAYLE